jgi:hypothetical protein
MRRVLSLAAILAAAVGGLLLTGGGVHQAVTYGFGALFGLGVGMAWRSR